MKAVGVVIALLFSLLIIASQLTEGVDGLSYARKAARRRQREERERLENEQRMQLELREQEERNAIEQNYWRVRYKYDTSALGNGDGQQPVYLLSRPRPVEVISGMTMRSFSHLRNLFTCWEGIFPRDSSENSEIVEKTQQAQN